jgi:hypothetical protein
VPLTQASFQENFSDDIESWIFLKRPKKVGLWLPAAAVELKRPASGGLSQQGFSVLNGLAVSGHRLFYLGILT